MNRWDRFRESQWFGVVEVTVSFTAGLALAFLASLTAQGAEPFGRVDVIDGDTIRLQELRLGWDVSLTNVTIRAADYDAWESSKRRRSVDVTDDEVEKGKAATEALKGLIDSGELEVQPATFIGKDRDNYGRLIGRLFVDGQPVSVWMLHNGHWRNAPQDGDILDGGIGGKFRFDYETATWKAVERDVRAD